MLHKFEYIWMIELFNIIVLVFSGSSFSAPVSQELSVAFIIYHSGTRREMGGGGCS